MKKTIIVTLTALAFLLTGPAVAKETNNNDNPQETRSQVVTVRDQPSQTLPEVKKDEPRYERGKSKLEQQHEKQEFRGRSKPLLIIADF